MKETMVQLGRRKMCLKNSIVGINFSDIEARYFALAIHPMAIPNLSPKEKWKMEHHNKRWIKRYGRMRGGIGSMGTYNCVTIVIS